MNRARGQTKDLVYYDDYQDHLNWFKDKICKALKIETEIVHYDETKDVYIYNKKKTLGPTRFRPIVVYKARSVGATTITKEALEMYYRNKRIEESKLKREYVCYGGVDISSVVKDKSLYAYTEPNTPRDTNWSEASAFTLNSLEFVSETAPTEGAIAVPTQMSQNVI